ncbi:MAG: ferrous iron transport protein B [Armatimonadetes bacterium]|nr:ferrous iron transport protein B [Armatimonadota bacterium]
MDAGERVLRIAVAGSPNAGKTTLFNRLTGLRHKVGNYPGVTVERKEGAAVIDGEMVDLLDLPGSYSLSAQSPDEEVARDVLFGWQPGCEPPDVVLIVIDAAHLERNLFLTSQIVELGYPTVLALNMVDVARAAGMVIDADELSRRLGVAAIPVVATTGEGLAELGEALLRARPSAMRVPLKPAVEAEAQRLGALLEREGVAPALASPVALRLLSSAEGLADATRQYGPALAAEVTESRRALEARGVVWLGCEASSRYSWLREVAAATVVQAARPEGLNRHDRIDRVLTHRFWGPVVFFAIMAVVFQSIYTWAGPAMDAIDSGMGAVGAWTKTHLPAGPLNDLLSDGVIAGVGGVIIFLPQILILFFFLAMLEETGYMARAAFVMDRVMSRVGLHGRAFVPLLSGFACSVPGIMAARTISNGRDRLATILVTPLMTCSARLPVYALLIGAFVPKGRILGGLVSQQGLALFGLYFLGTVMALSVAAVLKRTVLRGPTPSLVLELPPYRQPNWRNVGRELWDRAGLFVKFAGTIILSMSIVLWFLASFPRHGDGTASDIQQSYLGRAGRVVEPVLRPLGYDWRVGVACLSAAAAREVVVSTLGVLFEVGKDDADGQAKLGDRLKQATWPDGRPLFTVATAWSLMIFVALACQCMTTVGIVIQETGGWRWAMWLVAYTTALAYFGALITYQGLRLAGLG